MSEKGRKVGLFIGISFFISWSIAALFIALGGRWNTSGAIIVATAYMFGPMISAIFVQKFIYKEALKKPLGVSFKLNRWFLVAWLLPPAIALVTLGVSLIFPGVEYSPEMTGLLERFKGVLPPERLQRMKDQIATFPVHPFWIALIQGLIVGPTVNAVAGFGEEVGWRGFLQRELGYMGFWRSSALIGLIWGIWHIPIILQGHNYPQHPVQGVFMMIIFCLLLAPVFSYIRIKANSVIASAIAHGSLNATAGVAIMVIKGGNDLLVGVTGLSGFITLVLVNIGLFLYERSLTRKPVMVR